MAWRVANSILLLRKEINAFAPNRSKISDGTIGDAAHATRASDHNPWIIDKRGVPVVTAIDITHDPGNFCNCIALAEHLRKLGEAGDRRVKYVIWNRQITSAKTGWKWIPYTGRNPHTKHLHLSVSTEQIYYDSAKGWGIAASIGFLKPAANKLVAQKLTTVPQFITLREGMKGENVETLQGILAARGRKSIKVDGYFGPKTKSAVQALQLYYKMRPTGKVDQALWLKMLRPILK